MTKVSINSVIARELGARETQIVAAVTLLDEGASVPFIARYRKEMTEGLDDTQLRRLDERLRYLRDMEERRRTILASIAEQGKLNPALEAALNAAETKARLEDLYLPYKPRRRTRAQIAREAGLGPLAERLWADPTEEPEHQAAAFVAPDAGIADARAALEGARSILIETFSEDAELLGALRSWLWNGGVLSSCVVDGKTQEGAKFSDYFDYREKIAAIPSHRALALFRGRNEGVLSLKLHAPDEAEAGFSVRNAVAGEAERRIAARFALHALGRPGDAWMAETVRWAWRVKIQPHLETELLQNLRDAADEEAIRVFSRNLRAVLLGAPAGTRAVLGLDPGIRTGVKAAAVDATGKLLQTVTVYPHPPRNDWQGAIAALSAMILRHGIDLVAIGNGTASRETTRLVLDLIRLHPKLSLTHAVVSEAGASVYSASELAAGEFPELDVSLRGAVSIARRLQDPLAELVKIDPKSIGVGQYQHDVNQTNLGRALDGVVEDCVNGVGVDLNTASVSLLARVSGLNSTLARNIVVWRDVNGAFRNRAQLLKVGRLGPKAFEQAAGFLRIPDGDNPLDASAVHPESYPLVEKIQTRCRRGITDLVGDVDFLRSLNVDDFVDERFGAPTVRDILLELEKPGRDPRPDFRTAVFREGVETLEDLQPGMTLEGVVTNVANFGAFVDIGVHQDGLVHISALADRFVDDPHSVVKAGDLVRVRVMEVDRARRRIALTMRLGDTPLRSSSPEKLKTPASGERGRQTAKAPTASAADKGGRRRDSPSSSPSVMTGALAEAFARAKAKK